MDFKQLYDVIEGSSAFSLFNSVFPFFFKSIFDNFSRSTKFRSKLSATLQVRTIRIAMSHR